MRERFRESGVRLLPVTEQLLDEAEILVGGQIKLVSVPALPNESKATLRLPRRDGESPVIIFSERDIQYVDHLVAHELGHLRRLQNAPAEERLVPISTAANRRRAAQQLEPDLRKLIQNGYAPERTVASLFPVWVEGLVSQLVNTPPDIRIEREIHQNIPELCDLQNESLLAQAKEMERRLSPIVIRFTPSTVYRISQIMNYALVREISQLVGKAEILNRFSEGVNRQLADKLYDIVSEEPDSGTIQDRTVIEKWAKHLGLTDWFEWMHIDEIKHLPIAEGRL